MASFRSAGDVAAELRKLGKELETQDALRTTREMAERGQQIADRQVRRDLGADGEFSGWEGRLETKITEFRNGAGHVLSPASRLDAAKFTVAEHGRHPDGGVGRFQGPGVNMRTGRTSRSKRTGQVIVRGRRAGIRWNGTTRGKQTASKAVAEMRRGDMDEIAERGVQRALRRHFDV